MARRSAKTNGNQAALEEQMIQLGAEMASAMLHDPQMADVLAEGMSAADLKLALEDRGWLRLGQDYTGELTPDERRQLIQLSRLYYQYDPLSKQAVRLWTDYTVGTGLSFQIEKKKQLKLVQGFWRDPRNRPVLSGREQRKNSRRLLLDGELFFAVVDVGDELAVRRIDALEMNAPLTDPEDAERILYWRRDVTGKVEPKYYLHWAERHTASGDLPMVKDGPKAVSPGDVEVSDSKEPILIYPVAFEAIKHRGIPLLSAALSWSREHRRFMEARVAIVRALAKFVWKGEVKGGAATVEAIRKKFASTLSSSKTTETNPPAAPGSSWIENEALKLSAIPRSTGGTEARDDGDMLKLQVAAGTGWPLHYFGDAANANLATATAMELPVLKAMESYQNLWTEVYTDLMRLKLEQAGVSDAEEAVIDLDWPPIVQRDIVGISDALSKLLVQLPQVNQPEVTQLALTLLGLNNVDQIMARIKEEEEEKQAEQAKNPQPAPPTEEELGKLEAVLAQSLRSYREALERGR